MNDRLIDRLVAGDLDERERRELLGWLDAEPDRWRRCAMGFLEAQLWQETFGGVVRRAQNEVVSPAVTPPGAARRHARPSLRLVSAMAAAVLFAFSLGLSAGSLSPWLKTSGPETLPVAHQPSPSTTEGESGQLRSNAVSNNSVAAEDADSTSVRLAQGGSRSPSVQTFAVLKVATQDSGTREIHLPVVEGPTADSRWLRAEPEALPDYLQRQLEERGYQLQQCRRFMEVKLEDGRHALIPVDQYQVKFVGGRAS
ncbi:MAG: hypothetical protein HY000_04840 [Planctomycetes bacterium]|nr:hypothetical protein [Planctomycetota bacterium]